MAKSYVTVPIGYRRVDNLPLEKNTLFEDLQSAKDYAASDVTAYVGQRIGVIDGNHVYEYIITAQKKLALVTVQGLQFEPTESPYIINHEMDGYPTIKCIGNDGNLILANVRYIDRDSVEVTWNGEFLGIVVLS